MGGIVRRDNTKTDFAAAASDCGGGWDGTRLEEHVQESSLKKLFRKEKNVFPIFYSK